MRVFFLSFVVVSTVLPGVSSKHLPPFKHKLSQHEAAYDKSFHDRLKGQVASQHASHVSTSARPSPSNTTHASADASSGLFADGSTNSFTLYDSSNIPTPNPSSSCVTALEATIACNSTIPLMTVYDFLFQDLSNLLPVCTSACASALANYRANVVNACGKYTVVDSTNNTYAPTYAVDSILAAYGVQCLFDSTAQTYCYPVVSGYNTTGGLLNLPTNELCTYCTLETLNVTLSNPITFNYPLWDLLSSAISKCGPAYTKYQVTGTPSAPVTPPSTSTFGVSGSTPLNPQCQFLGKNISVTSNTTCSALAVQYQVSPNDIRSNNPAVVDASCQIAAPITLCIPPACALYTVQANDTCDSISARSSNITGTSITAAQLTSINPELGVSCQGITSLVGTPICIGPNGGWPNVGASTTALPSFSPTAVASIPSSTGPGSTSACGRWYLTQPGDTCNALVNSQAITLSDFLTINPEVNSNCTNLWLNYNYCVAPFPALTSTGVSSMPTGNFSSGGMNNDPLPTAGYTPTFYTQTLDSVGIPAPTNLANGTRTINCGYYYDVESGDTLSSISSLVQLNTSDLEMWNPQLALAAPVTGTSICVRFPTGNYTLANATRPANAAPKSTTDCAQWYTVVGGDGCPSIESEFGLTSGELSQLNPDINAACTTLQLGAAYCVLSVYAPGYSTAPTPTGPPSNLAAGSLSNCTVYHTVASGDTCSSMEAAANISATDLLRWNPEVNVTSCTNIQLGAAYCVGGGGNKCSKLYTVASGDYCSKVETTVGLTDAQFRSYNLWLDTNCNMQVGQVMCVGPPAATTTSKSTSTTPAATTTASKTTTTTTSASSVPTNLAIGSWTNCTSYYNVQSGDTCASIDTKYTIAYSDFLRWNPEITTTCTNIGLSSYCVKATPATCKKIYTVASGDWCSKIEAAQGISDATLQSLNPWLDASCDVQPGQNLCVG